MARLLESKLVAWFALFIVIAIIVVTFRMRPAWWAFIDEFFAFMMVFCQLASLYMMKISVYGAKKMRVFAAACGILMILALIGEFIAMEILF